MQIKILIPKDSETITYTSDTVHINTESFESDLYTPSASELTTSIVNSTVTLSTSVPTNLNYTLNKTYYDLVQYLEQYMEGTLPTDLINAIQDKYIDYIDGCWLRKGNENMSNTFALINSNNRVVIEEKDNELSIDAISDELMSNVLNLYKMAIYHGLNNIAYQLVGLESPYPVDESTIHRYLAAQAKYNVSNAYNAIIYEASSDKESEFVFTLGYTNNSCSDVNTTFKLLLTSTTDKSNMVSIPYTKQEAFNKSVSTTGNEFIITLEVTSNNKTFFFQGIKGTGTVNWGDSTPPNTSGSHTYQEEGTYVVSITNALTVRFNPDYVHMVKAFNSLGNLEDTSWMFYSCVNSNAIDLRSWDVTNLTNTDYMFANHFGEVYVNKEDVTTFSSSKGCNPSSEPSEGSTFIAMDNSIDLNVDDLSETIYLDVDYVYTYDPVELLACYLTSTYKDFDLETDPGVLAFDEGLSIEGEEVSFSVTIPALSTYSISCSIKKKTTEDVAKSVSEGNKVYLSMEVRAGIVVDGEETYTNTEEVSLGILPKEVLLLEDTSDNYSLLKEVKGDIVIEEEVEDE